MVTNSFKKNQFTNSISKHNHLLCISIFEDNCYKSLFDNSTVCPNSIIVNTNSVTKCPFTIYDLINLYADFLPSSR